MLKEIQIYNKKLHHFSLPLRAICKIFLVTGTYLVVISSPVKMGEKKRDVSPEGAISVWI